MGRLIGLQVFFLVLPLTKLRKESWFSISLIYSIWSPYSLGLPWDFIKVDISFLVTLVTSMQISYNVVLSVSVKFSILSVCRIPELPFLLSRDKSVRTCHWPQLINHFVFFSFWLLASFVSYISQIIWQFTQDVSLLSGFSSFEKRVKKALRLCYSSNECGFVFFNPFKELICLVSTQSTPKRSTHCCQKLNSLSQVSFCCCLFSF